MHGNQDQAIPFLSIILDVDSVTYSSTKDGAFCINCVLLGGESSHNATKLEQLFKLPFDNWPKATTRFHDHAGKSPVHKTATLRATQFRSCLESKTSSINIMMNSHISEQVRINREKIVPIVEAILLCGVKTFLSEDIEMMLSTAM